MKGKKILIEVLHPAHVHLFRNFIQYLKENNVEYKVVSRDKDITNKLLEYYNIAFESISKAQVGMFNLIVEAISRDYKILKLQLANKFDVAFTTGTSFSAAHISKVTALKSFNFIEDDDDIVGLYCKLTYPFIDKIVIPDCLEYSTFKEKRVSYPSYHELAYLHPNNFTPDSSVLKKYNLEPFKFIIARFSALEAHHDVGVKGISENLWQKIEQIISGYTVIKSIEKSKTHQIDPWDMHHVLAFSAMVICDSQTMTAEAAVLGVPSVRINTFARKIGYLKELEFKYQLTKSFLPEEEDSIISYITNLIDNSFEIETYQQRRKVMLSEKIDFNQWIIDFFNREVVKL
jgi:predicted glycosyltransferase